jgi:hypothetical protein
MGAENQVLVQVDAVGAILLGDRDSLWYKGRKVPLPPGSIDVECCAQTISHLPVGESAETSLRTTANVYS